MQESAHGGRIHCTFVLRCGHIANPTHANILILRAGF